MSNIASIHNYGVVIINRINFLLSIGVGCFMLGVVSGCAHRNEGAVEYRKSEIAAGSGQSTVGTAFSAFLELGQVGTTKIKVPAFNLQGERVRLVPLQRKNLASMAPNTSFTDQDAISIRLLTAYIKTFSEGWFSNLADAVAEGQFEPRGEVAVVVNAFQLGNQGADFDFSDKGINRGRVVFFSQDVERNQFLNFSNMAVYGPVTYQAKPIGLDIAVMELDLSDKVTMDLLNRLASLGGKAFPATAPGLEILNSLGDTLVQQQTNDINARYALLFDAPEGGHPDVPRVTLEVGNYVFIRAEDRNKDINWEKLLLDENTGQVYIKKHKYKSLLKQNEIAEGMKGSDGPEESDGYVVELYRNNNYFTFQVNKNEAAASIDLPNYDFGTFLKELNTSVAEDNKDLKKIVEPIDELVEKRVQIALFDDVRSNLGTLLRNKVTYDGKLKEEAESKEEAQSKESSKKDPSDTALEEALNAAKSARVRAEGVLLRQFNKVWKAFEPSLVGSTDSGAGICTDVGKEADKTVKTEKETTLSEKQCNYVLAEFEEIVQVSDSTSLKYFQSDDPDLQIAERKKNICKLLFGLDTPGVDSCVSHSDR